MFLFFFVNFFPHTEYAVSARFGTVHFVSGQWLPSLAENLGPELGELFGAGLALGDPLDVGRPALTKLHFYSPQAVYFIGELGVTHINNESRIGTIACQPVI